MASNGELTDVGILTTDNQCSNLDMDIFETRRQRLKKLIYDDFGDSRAAFARHMGMHPPQVSRWLNDEQPGKKRPNIKETSAREIEARCFKPSGWLDTDAPFPTLSDIALKVAELVSGLPGVQQAHMLHLVETTMEMQRQAAMVINPKDGH